MLRPDKCRRSGHNDPESDKIHRKNTGAAEMSVKKIQIQKETYSIMAHCSSTSVVGNGLASDEEEHGNVEPVVL